MEEGADPDAMEDPVASSSSSEAARVAAGAVGPRCCEIRVVGEVIFRLGPFSRKAEEVTVSNMRRAYERFPGIVAEWKRKQTPDPPRAWGTATVAEDERREGVGAESDAAVVEEVLPELIRELTTRRTDSGTRSDPWDAENAGGEEGTRRRRAFEKISYPTTSTSSDVTREGGGAAWCRARAGMSYVLYHSERPM